MVIGTYGTLTLDQAREKAGKHLVAVRDGKNPLDDRALGRRQGTLRELAEAYFTDREEKGRKTVATMRRRFERNIPKAWLSRLASSVTRSEIRGLHASIGRRVPYEANRTLEILLPMFRMGISGTLNDPETGLWFFASDSVTNPASEIDRFPETKRKRFVTEDELPTLAQQIDLHPDIYLRGALWCYLLTGARKEELLCARRTKKGSEPFVDWEAETLELPDPKSGEHQSIPLTGPAMAILQALPVATGNPYIFVGRREGRHLVNVDKPWGKIRKAAGLEDVRLHDLRRTVGAWMSKSGTDLNVIKHALRHANLATTLVYARLGQDPARAALEEHGRRVMEIAGKRAVASDDDGG
jgi:integrase